jgi:CheY-like chemotaxis protein
MVFPSESDERSARLKGRRVLVVEDQSLIAMEVEDCLSRAGVDVVGPVGRLDRAMMEAEKQTLDGALLDVDLNGVRCWPVADLLAARAIPFALTTGFARGIVTPERFADYPVLTKPYREEDMLAVLDEMLAA